MGFMIFCLVDMAYIVGKLQDCFVQQTIPEFNHAKEKRVKCQTVDALMM